MFSHCHCEFCSRTLCCKRSKVVKLPESIQVFPWFLWSETARYLCFGGMLQTHQNGVLEADLSPNANSAPVSVDSCELVT